MMRKLLFSALLLFGFDGASAQSLQVNPSTVNMGDIALKSKNRVTVACVNISDKPLVIRDIQTDCTCTKPAWGKAPIMPGDSTLVTITLTPTERGAFYKSVRFVTAPGSEKVPQVVLRGKVY